MMDAKRWNELEVNGGKLTEQEKAEGYFFCCDFDYMLINKSWGEAKLCSCLTKESE